YPSIVQHLDVGRENSIASLEQAMEEEQLIFLTTQTELAVEQPTSEDIYYTGTVARINQMLKLPNGGVRILVEGLYRAEVNEFTNEKDIYEVKLEKRTDIAVDPPEEEALMRQLLDHFEEYIKLSKKITKETLATVLDVDEPSRLTFMISSNLPIKMSEKQQLMEIDDVEERMLYLLKLIVNEKKVLHLEHKIGKRVQTSMEKTQKEYYLREQLKAIQNELGESEGKLSEVEQLKEKIEERQMPEKINEIALKELERYERIPQSSAESSVIRTYLDWLIDLPWHEKTEDTIEIEKAETILNEDHYGLEKVKERIIEYLAVQKLTDSIKGPILCIVGPPGVGKTSLAKSIARSVGRNFVRVSLGGVRDEAEIRGHRRTYIGAMHGRIIRGMKKSETVNPVFLLDELDKVANDFRGDPSSALLEVLDPEQNFNFSDHFIEETYDLSNVLFIATANSVTSIPGPLLDRMELLSIAGY